MRNFGKAGMGGQGVGLDVTLASLTQQELGQVIWEHLSLPLDLDPLGREISPRGLERDPSHAGKRSSLPLPLIKTYNQVTFGCTCTANSGLQPTYPCPD